MNDDPRTNFIKATLNVPAIKKRDEARKRLIELGGNNGSEDEVKHLQAELEQLNAMVAEEQSKIYQTHPYALSRGQSLSQTLNIASAIRESDELRQWLAHHHEQVQWQKGKHAELDISDFERASTEMKQSFGSEVLDMGHLWKCAFSVLYELQTLNIKASLPSLAIAERTRQAQRKKALRQIPQRKARASAKAKELDELIAPIAQQLIEQGTSDQNLTRAVQRQLDLIPATSNPSDKLIRNSLKRLGLLGN